jgi:ribonucleotide reductase alpha subunit
MQDGAAQKMAAGAAGQQTTGASHGGHSEPVEAQTRGKRVASTVAGLEFPRFFSTAGSDPFDQIEWELRDAVIGGEKGQVVFEQRQVEMPKAWSQQATNIVVSKYFRGHVGSPERERSVKQLIGRVVETITEWARRQKYFASDEALSAFSQDLKHLLVHQQAAFNSPVWFNCGFEKAPQCSACFINAVDDTMESILTLAKTEGMLFKYGSGTGSNLSSIRSSKELLAGGGTASGPVSFMKGFDAFAGVIKSGGKTRRAAKMVILNAEHPDIVEFINCKVEEEKKAWAPTVNEWHTSANTARINASNPCSEYMFLDDSACNLSSLNLMTFVGSDGEFDAEAFKAAVRTLITAQEILVDNSSYPTKAIEKNSHAYRPLGLGYANLGALLMSRGLPYDSDQGRDFAAAITALMTGEAYAQSARVARDHGGPFAGYDVNREPFLRVMRKHRDAMKDINPRHVPADLYQAAKQSWDDAVELGEDFGYRNAQATVLAPTGTIGFMMDCDTTGVEPDIALVKYKKLVGGGMMKIVNTTVPMALKKLGYTASQVTDIIAHIDSRETIEGAPHLLDRDLAVFDCAFKAANGERSIHYMGHIKMMGATQPFISGAISKTVNVPKEATVDEIEQAYLESWRLGAKAISIYRDGSKRTQPLNTSKDASSTAKPIDTKAAIEAAVAAAVASRTPVRRKLPDERHALTHKFDIAGHEGYVTVGLFEDGMPGEIFLVMAKEGSTISGFADAFAQAISYALQYGVPLQALVDKFSHVRFEPSGMTKNPDVRFAKSIVDYIFRWMASKFLSPEAQYVAGVNNRDDVADASSGGHGHVELPKVVIPAPAPPKPVAATKTSSFAAMQNQEDAPPCSTCGSIMVRSGACYKCSNCGTTSGCA